MSNLKYCLALSIDGQDKEKLRDIFRAVLDENGLSKAKLYDAVLKRTDWPYLSIEGQPDRKLYSGDGHPIIKRAGMIEPVLIASIPTNDVPLEGLRQDLQFDLNREKIRTNISTFPDRGLE